MKLKSLLFYKFVGLSIAVVGLFAIGFNYYQSSPKTIIRAKFLLAHNPTNLKLVEHTKQFAMSVQKRTEGRVLIDLIYPPERGRDGNYFPWASQQIRKGEAQISQIGTSALSRFDTSWQFFDLPFLFNDHQHASQVLDSELGVELKTKYLETVKAIRPLAFTYSGGYRIFISNTKLISASDLKNKKIAVVPLVKLDPEKSEKRFIDSIRQKTVEAFGMKAVKPDMYEKSETEYFTNGMVDVGEDHYGHYTRVFKNFGAPKDKMKYIWDTEHSLFLTSIVTNEKFYQSLSLADRQILEDEAYNLALLERKDSIETDLQSKKWFLENGYFVQTPSVEVKGQLRKMVEPVYQSFINDFGQSWIQKANSMNPSSIADN